MSGLAVVETHPVQYHVPVYKYLQKHFNIPVNAVYGSDRSIRGYYDKDFNLEVAWDTDLLSGYTSIFLSKYLPGEKRLFEPAFLGIGKALRRIKPDVVMIVGNRPYFHHAAFRAALRNNYPIIFRAETISISNANNKVFQKVKDAVLRRKYKKIRKFLYIGKESLNYYQRLGIPEEKLIFSPYCVDKNRFDCEDTSRKQSRERTRMELGIPNDAIVLMFSGKLYQHKDPSAIILAVRGLADKMRERIVLIFMGDGELRNVLENVDSAGTPHVETRFIGFINQSGMSRYFHASDILIFPSKHERWGLVVNEALYHGIPCVVSDKVGCAPDLIDAGITGEVFETGNIDSLRDAIRTVIKLAGRDDIRESCRRKADSYSVENAAKGIAEAYSMVRNSLQ